MSAPYREGRFRYYRRYEDGREYEIHCRRPLESAVGPAAAADGEQVILDVNRVAAGHEFCQVASRPVSPSGHLLAYAVDTVGRRQYTIRVRDLAAGEELAGRHRRRHLQHRLGGRRQVVLLRPPRPDHAAPVPDPAASARRRSGRRSGWSTRKPGRHVLVRGLAESIEAVHPDRVAPDAHDGVPLSGRGGPGRAAEERSCRGSGVTSTTSTTTAAGSPSGRTTAPATSG